MLTLRLKWLNGEIQSVEVPKGATVLKVIQQLGLSPAETTLFSEERVIEHYEKVSGDLSILVQPVPVSIFVYQKGEDCYFSSEESSGTI